MNKPDKRLKALKINFSELKPLPIAPGYWVSPYGDVYSIKKLTPRIYSDGYARISLFGKTRGHKRIALHQAVAMAFLPPAKKGQTIVRHRDRNKKNNHVLNLLWGTHKDNSQDMVGHGKSLRGEKNHKCKLTVGKVLRIRRVYKKSHKISFLAKQYGVSNSTIDAIVHRRNWRWLK